MIFKKLLLSYFLIIVIPLFILSLIVTNITTRIINEEINKSACNILDQASQNVSNILENLKGAALLLSKNDSIQDGLSREPKDKIDLAAQINDMRNSLLNNGVYYQKYSSIQVYAMNNEDYAPVNTMNDVMSYKLVQGEDWYKETVKREGKLYWNVSDMFGSTMVNVSKVIYDLKDHRRMLGVISVSVDISKFELILRQIRIGKTGAVYLIDGKGNPIYPRNVDIRLPVNAMSNKDFVASYLNINGNNTMFMPKHLSETDWRVVSLIPVDSLFEKTVTLKKTIFFIAVASMLIAILVSLTFSLNLSKPIIRLARTMKEVKNGKLDLHVETPLKGEVGILYGSFNSMIGMIKSLIQDVYVTKIKQKEAELKALEAQINPHFLYNTLDAINWMAKKYKADDISKMVTSLASLLRYSINKGEDIIEIEKELKQVEGYLNIQKIRYSNKFETYFNIDEKMLCMKITKLILQPLVENAIIHGLAKAPDNGYLIVNGYLKEGYIVFEVINNGLPVSLEKVNDILHKGDDYTGHGIRNVDQRLKLTYGNDYGISYRVEGSESIASIRIPCFEPAESAAL